MDRISKLEELRTKTDRELIALIDNDLRRGRILAEQFQPGAEDLYAEARRLLPKVFDTGERQRLAQGLRRLRQALDERSLPRVRTAGAD
jgi:hypothetical protein